MARFSDVLVIINGKNQAKVENANGKYPIYGSGGIMGRADDYLCDAETVVIGRKGSINKPIFVEEPFWNVDTAFGLAANREKLLPKYLFYFCVYFDFEKLNTTVTIPSLTKANLLEIEMNLPELGKQRQIVNELTKVDDLISLRKQQLAKLDELVKARFVELFGDPERWNTGLTNLGDHIDLVNGYAFLSEKFTEEGIPVIKIRNVNTADFSRGNMQCHPYDSNLDKYLIYPDDLLISLTGTVGKEDFANVCLVDDSYEKYYLNQRNAKLQPHEELIPEYLLHVLKQNYIKKELIKKGTGVRQCHLHNKDVNSVQLIIPDKEIQKQFAAFVKQTDKSKLTIQQSLDKLETLKKSLMQKYFG